MSTDWLLRGDRSGVPPAAGRDPAWTGAVTLLQTVWTHPEWRAAAIAVLRAPAGVTPAHR